MLAFDPTGDRLAVACGDSAYVWDLSRLEENLVKSGLGWTPVEKSLSAAHARRAAGANSSDPRLDFAETRDTLNDVPRPFDPAETGAARFVLDEHFQQLQITSDVLRAQRAIEKGDFRFAKFLLAKATSQNPNTAVTCNNLAWVLATGPASVRDVQNAEMMARRAVALRPNESTFLNTLGVALYRVGNFSDAIVALEKSLVTNPPANQPYDLLFLAMSYAHQGDLAKAHENQKRAMQLIEQNANGQSKLWHHEVFEFAQEAQATLETCSAQKAVDSVDDH